MNHPNERVGDNEDDHDQDRPLEQQRAVIRKSLAKLDVQRKSLEHEADAIYLELTTPPEEGIEPMGIDTPLVDKDGYPRGDIDIYRSKTLRNRFRIIQTDHKRMVQQIDAMLIQLASIQVRGIHVLYLQQKV
jgi:hypothetical protein